MSRLIDADIFEVVGTKIPEGMDAESYMAGMDFVLNKIDDAPTIEPERKTGKWIEVRIMPKAFDITGDETWASVMQCDKCGFEMFAVEGHMAQYNFCPSCGADMRGDNNG